MSPAVHVCTQSQSWTELLRIAYSMLRDQLEMAYSIDMSSFTKELKPGQMALTGRRAVQNRSLDQSNCD